MWQCQKPTARIQHFFGNKAKERISKWVFQENKSTPNFSKKKRHILPPDTYTIQPPDSLFCLIRRHFNNSDNVVCQKKQKTKVIPGNMNDVNNYYIKFFFHFQYSLKCGQYGQRRIPKQKVCNECGQRGISKTVK